MGDFNAEPHYHFLVDFCNVYNLKNLIKVSTCFKNPKRPTSIDLILTNSYRSFQNSCAIEKRLLDFHQKKERKIMQYREYKTVPEEEYRKFLELGNLGNIGKFSFLIMISVYPMMCFQEM